MCFGNYQPLPGNQGLLSEGGQRTGAKETDSWCHQACLSARPSPSVNELLSRRNDYTHFACLYTYVAFRNYLFIFGCAGSLLLPRLKLQRAEDTLWWWCSGFSLWRLLLLGSMGAPASVAVAHGLSCSVTCGIFLDQGSNTCLLH